MKRDAEGHDEHDRVEALVGCEGEQRARRDPPAADHGEEEEGEPAVGHDRRRLGRARRHDVRVEQVGELDVARHAPRLLLPHQEIRGVLVVLAGLGRLPLEHDLRDALREAAEGEGREEVEEDEEAVDPGAVPVRVEVLEGPQHEGRLVEDLAVVGVAAVLGESDALR